MSKDTLYGHFLPFFIYFFPGHFQFCLTLCKLLGKKMQLPTSWLGKHRMSCLRILADDQVLLDYLQGAEHF